MSSELPNSNESPSGNQEDRNNIFSEDVLILAFIAILAPLLKVKFQNGSKSAFEMDIATMAAFLIVLQAYCFALLAKKKLIKSHRSYAEIINRYVHLCGFLSNVLLLMMLVPVLGQIFLGIWVFCFIIVTYWLLAKTNARPANARNGDNLDIELNMSANEEPNGDGFNQAPNGSTDEESNGDDNSAVKPLEIFLG